MTAAMAVALFEEPPEAATRITNHQLPITQFGR